VFELHSLSVLNAFLNALTSLPPAVSRLTALTRLHLSDNSLTRLPRELARCTALESLNVARNGLVEVPVELSDLRCLTSLHLRTNQLRWLPYEFLALSRRCAIDWSANLLEGSPAGGAGSHFPPSLSNSDVFALTTHVGMIRRRATEICIGLQDLNLPALLTLLIIDELLPNSIRMWAKWELITTIKHLRER
jgi:Leucine-rich repeat (LRR) protein